MGSAPCHVHLQWRRVRLRRDNFGYALRERLAETVGIDAGRERGLRFSGAINADDRPHPCPE